MVQMVQTREVSRGGGGGQGCVGGRGGKGLPFEKADGLVRKKMMRRAQLATKPLLEA